jgi:hypothetical protein
MRGVHVDVDGQCIAVPGIFQHRQLWSPGMQLVRIENTQDSSGTCRARQRGTGDFSLQTDSLLDARHGPSSGPLPPPCCPLSK